MERPDEAGLIAAVRRGGGSPPGDLLVGGIARRFREDLESGIADLREGRAAYHPTSNNCTVVSLKALSHLGLEVAATRYFTRRFPRPAFEHILKRLPRLVASGRLRPRRIELAFVPQVPVRPSEGGAPNRPLRDRARVEASSPAERTAAAAGAPGLH